MVTEDENKTLNDAIGNIQDGIAGIREIKVALGMTDESHIEKDLKAALRKIERVLGTEKE